MSDQIWFQRVIGDPSGFDGFWMCPTPNCGGAGFTFDIFPTDPNHPANDGWHYDDEEIEEDADAPDGEWDPTESKYQDFDEEEDDDVEGEEWKHGGTPQPPDPEWLAEARRQEEERQREFDEPDRRPREIHRTKRDEPGPEAFNSDDVPF